MAPRDLFPDPADLIIRDGDMVEADGLIVARPGEPIGFGPTLFTGTYIAFGWGIRDAAPVNLDELDERDVTDGVVVGKTFLRGIFHPGSLSVVEQGHITPWIPITGPLNSDDESGEHRYHDLNRLRSYLFQHRRRFTGILRDYEIPDGAAPGTITVGVAVGDAGDAECELQALFGPGVRAIRFRYGPDQLQRAEEALTRLRRDAELGIHMTGRVGEWRFLMQLAMITPDIYDRLVGAGLDAIEPVPWLVPSASAPSS